MLHGTGPDEAGWDLSQRILDVVTRLELQKAGSAADWGQWIHEHGAAVEAVVHASVSVEVV